MIKEVENWWKQAGADIKSANNSFNSNDYYASIFWSQQAVEKALKALYLKTFNEIPRIHDLTIFANKLNLPFNLYQNCEDLTIGNNIIFRIYSNYSNVISNIVNHFKPI